MDKTIISNVTEQGLLIPPKWLIGIDTVKILKRQNIITITPIEKNDPIFELGKKPVSCGITNGSVEHDKYVYG